MKDFNLKTIDNLGIGFFRYHLGTTEGFDFASPSLLKMLGYNSAALFKKKRLSELFINVYERDNFFRQLKKSKKVNFFEAALAKKGKKAIFAAVTVLRVRSTRAGRIFEGVVEDITRHKRLEEKIALERDSFQGLLDNMPDAIYFKDKKNRITGVNKFYIQGAGLKKEDIIGKTDFDFFPREQAEGMFKDDNLVLTSGKPIVGKIEKTLLSDGTWNQVITTKIPLYDRKGDIVGTMGITRDMTAYANSESQRFKMLMNSFVVLGKALEMRDPYTFAHTRSVAKIAEMVAKFLDWDEDRLLLMRLSGEVHDLGKISIPLDILNKPGKLTDLEYQLIQRHVENCYNLTQEIDFPFSLREIVYQHHERIDGSGYPRGLKANEISPEARVLAVSDVLEAMTSHRPYRAALGIDIAMQELESGRGKKYDTEIVNAVSKLIAKNEGKIFW